MTDTRTVFQKFLSSDACQQIYYEALRNYARNFVQENAPVSLGWERIVAQARMGGPNIYLGHPNDVQEVFTGVSLEMFRQVETLFCTRHGRSIAMVTKIISRQQELFQQQMVNEMAIWAICMYLAPKRNEILRVTLEKDGAPWLLESFDWEFSVVGQDSAPYQPIMICVYASDRNQVLSFQFGKKQNLENLQAMAIYQAINACRTPDINGSAGLRWKLPSSFCSTLPLSQQALKFCNLAGISVRVADEKHPALSEIRDTWATDLRGKQISANKLALVFDNYLYRKFESSPLLDEEDRGRDFSGLVGYNRDPLWQFPALRALFLAEIRTVGVGARIRLGSWHYTDPLLALWQGQEVKVLESPSNSDSIWVYDLDGDVICKADRE